MKVGLVLFVCASIDTLRNLNVNVWQRVSSRLWEGGVLWIFDASLSISSRRFISFCMGMPKRRENLGKLLFVSAFQRAKEAVPRDMICAKTEHDWNGSLPWFPLVNLLKVKRWCCTLLEVSQPMIRYGMRWRIHLPKRGLPPFPFLCDRSAFFPLIASLKSIKTRLFLLFRYTHKEKHDWSSSAG